MSPQPCTPTSKTVTKVSPTHLDLLPSLLLTNNTWKPLSHLTVFNFFEPLHYYTFNTGFQTWELSPEHAIRSWAYILMHWPLAHLAPFALKIQKVSLRSYIAHSNLIKDNVVDSCYPHFSLAPHHSEQHSSSSESPSESSVQSVKLGSTGPSRRTSTRGWGGIA